MTVYAETSYATEGIRLDNDTVKRLVQDIWGYSSETEATGNGTLLAIAKRLRTLLDTNTETTLLASAARTVTVASSDVTQPSGSGLILFVNVTLAGTGSITPALQVKDPVSGAYFTVWTAATAITGTGLKAYVFHTGAASAASWTEALQCPLGRTWRLNMTHNNANTITYSAGSSAVGG